MTFWGRHLRVGLALSGLVAGRTLRRRAEQHTPGIAFHSVPNSKADVEELLLNAEVDVAINCAPRAANARLRTSALGVSHYVCAMRADHPLASEPLSLPSFLAADHLLVSPSGETTGVVDEILQIDDHSRHVAITVNLYAQVAPLLLESDLIGTIPFETVAECVSSEALRVVTPPIEIPPISLSLVWHERSNRDAGQRWLRNEIESVMAESSRCHPMPANISSPPQQSAIAKELEAHAESTVFS